jgi:tetratricopeptide (TPR) repeat protein
MVKNPPRRRALVAALAAGLVALLPLAAPAQPPAEAASSAPGAIPVSVLAVPFPIKDATDAQVPVLVEIGGPELIAGAAGESVTGEIRGAASDSTGRVLEQFAQPFVLDPADETLQRTGLKLFAQLRLPVGDYRLRVEVSNAGTGATGSWEGSLRVPDFAAGELALSPPLFPEAAGRWRVFRQSDSAHEDLPYPFQGAGGETYLPAASPRVGTDGGAFHVFLYGATGLPQRFEGRLVGPRGEQIVLPLQVIAMASGGFAWERRLALQIAPATRPPGGYRLELLVGGTWGSGTTRSPVTVVGEAIAAPEPLGVVAEQQPRPRASEPVVDEPAVLPRNWQPSELAARYRDLLVRGSDNGLQTVAVELAEVELSATTDHRAGQVKALREVQTQVVDVVAAGGGDGLLPVIFLHYLADLELIRRGESWMAAQNRQWIYELMLRWLGKREDPATRRLAAQLLAAMGSSGRALELDGQNELALLRQAVLAEKGGNYKDAMVWIDRLLEAHPRSPQGRLRQAIVWRRLGQDDRAGQALARLIEDPETPRWMDVLAYQERAAMEYRAKRADRAVALLRQAIEKLGAQELYIQLAYYQDAAQRPDEAVAVVNRMPAIGDDSSARHLYNAPPAAEIAAARQQVEARLDGSVSQLRVALGAAPNSHEGSRR